MKIRTFQECRSTEGWQPVKIPSASSDGMHTVLVNPWGETRENICDCQGYFYRGTCSHQQKAAQKICGWNDNGIAEAQTDIQKDDMICPRCGAATRWEMEVTK